MPRFRRRRKSRHRCRPELSEPQILAWADSWHARTGRWPGQLSGVIPDSLGETWARVDNALLQGLRGLQGGSSIARLLHDWRGVRNPRDPPPLAVKQVTAWARAHRPLGPRGRQQGRELGEHQQPPLARRARLPRRLLAVELPR